MESGETQRRWWDRLWPFAAGGAATRRTAQDRPAELLYAQAVALARKPELFRNHGVADTVDGRFDALVLVVSVMMCRLGGHGKGGRALGQQLVDVMFADMDLSLREMGAGDMGVPKRVKIMARAFAGRSRAYSQALLNGDRDQLAAALERNLLRGETRAGKGLVDFVLRLDTRIDATDPNAFLLGRLDVG